MPECEDWQLGHLKDLIASLDAGVSVNGEDRPKRKGEYAVLKVSCVSGFHFDPTRCKPVIASDLDKVAESPRGGHIVVSRSNSPELVGASAIVPRDFPELFLSDKLWQLKLSNDRSTSAEWLWHFLTSPATRWRLSQLATGTSSSMKNISKNDLLTIPVLIPPFALQCALAEALRRWDHTITLTERLIAAKQQLRRSLMQQLLTGKRRFPDFVESEETRETRWGSYPKDWGYPRIDEVAQHISTINRSGKALPVLSCTKHRGLVDSLEYFGKQVYSKDLSTYKVVKRGQFAYATNHIEEGSIGYQDLHARALISPMYTVFEANESVNDRFLFLVLKTELYRHIFEANTSASVDRRGSLRWPEFARLHVPLPCLDEQRAIVGAFEIADKELTLLQTQLTALKTQKRGLMQQLLTGKVRVPLPADQSEGTAPCA